MTDPKFLLNGIGTNSTILFNPDKLGDFTDGTPRDPESSLAHESDHSYRDFYGITPATDKEQEVGATFKENELRKAKGGIPQRKSYGVWDVPFR